MSSHLHTPGQLQVVDGRRISATLPNEIGGGFDSHCVALAFNTDARLDAEANARRLVACWNACDGICTSGVEEIAAFGGIKDKMPVATKIFNQRDELLTALERVLETRSAEAKAMMSYEVASENYSDHSHESNALASAMTAASQAEADARAAIAKAKGGTP